MAGGSTEWRVPDVLSPAAQELLRIGRNEAYGRLTPTGPGSNEARSRLHRLRPEELFTGPVRSTDDARAVLAGMWLYHDYLDESHRISQDLHTATGSFWHAIMHRREGDFSNAKYWYARCRHHPALRGIAQEGRAALPGVARAGELERLVVGRWDPDGFVDVVEAIRRKPDDPLYAAAVKLQRAEWRGLLAHCADSAAGRQ